MSYGTKESFRRVPKTCPRVDAAASKFIDAVKECTSDLRTALIVALDEVTELEEKVKDLEETIEELREQVILAQG